MPFFNTTDKHNEIQLLMNRMLAIHQAVEKKEITLQELEQIAQLSTTDLDSRLKTDTTLDKLEEMLHTKDLVDIEKTESLTDDLKQFDAEHGDYLSLGALAVENQQTVAANLNDFALFYLHFMKFMSVQMKKGEFQDQYTLVLDKLAAKTDWLKWNHQRPERISFDPKQAEQAGLFEKFLAGKLKKDEWLTDLDIQRALNLLKLKQETHILPFTADDIGLALHFEREKHQHDDPKQAYVVPFIVNLGEDEHSRLNSHGVHWTRLLVEIDPRNSPPTIKAHYKDELSLAQGAEQKITKTLQKALKYKEKQGAYTTGASLKIYKAFPECDNPEISVTGSGEQKDGFTCGYRAIQGIVNDLSAQQDVATNAEYQGALIACKDNLSLRDFMYRFLLGKQTVNQKTKNQIQDKTENQKSLFEQSGNELHQIYPDLVEGQLFALTYPNLAKTIDPKNKFNSDVLTKLAELNKKLNDLRSEPSITEITEPADGRLSLDLDNILSNTSNYDKSLVLQVIFEKIAQFNTLTHLGLKSFHDLDQEILKAQLDNVPITTNITSEDLELESYLQSLDARNNLLEKQQTKVNNNADGWHTFFASSFSTSLKIPMGTSYVWMHDSSFEIKDNKYTHVGAIGFAKMLQYMAENSAHFSEEKFPFQEFKMTNQAFLDQFETISGMVPGLKNNFYADHSNIDMVVALRKHLDSEQPFVPFKKFNFNLFTLKNNNDLLLEEIEKILEKAQAAGLERLEFETKTFDLSEQDIQRFYAKIKANNYPIVLSFSFEDKINSPLLSKLQELENLGLANQRKAKLPSSSSSNTQAQDRGNIALGRIGKSILKTEGLATLNTNVQVQEQQQQQVQQQVQTAMDDENLPEEDELKEEPFSIYADDEELISKQTFYTKYNNHLSFRYTERWETEEQGFTDPNKFWAMITGVNSELFKYGIKKITRSAVEKLIDNLEHVQYGLHPDNLPEGFFLQKDKNDEVVLAYTKVNPPINRNKSPLTVQFSKARAANLWLGNALQFMSPKEAEELYNSFVKNKEILKLMNPLPDRDKCINQFFFLRDPQLPLSVRSIVLNHFITSMAKENAPSLQQKMNELFGAPLSAKNINALSDVLYEQGTEGLTKLFDSLQKIKSVNGEEFFERFKTCFIDSSENLNELTTDQSIEAINKLLTLSKEQKTWWCELTEQHTSDLNLPLDVNKEPGLKWANLSELTEGFLYFCGQLEELSPGLTLTPYCPFKGVADMRVGLDRLLTILGNAHNIKEQFCNLNELSLDAVGPFYASRYEGFKLVTAKMMLSLNNAYRNKPEEVKKLAEKDTCFRSGKNRIAANISAVDAFKLKKSVFMRYIAINNHVASLSHYNEAFDKINTINSNDEDYADLIQEHLMIILACFGTGVHGKFFSQKDMDSLIKWAQENDANQVQQVLNSWRGIRYRPVRPNIAEIGIISALTPKENSRDFINKIGALVSLYCPKSESDEFLPNPCGQEYLEILALLATNNKRIDAQLFQNVLYELEGMNHYGHISTSQPKFNFAPQLRVATARLLAVCKSDGLAEENVLEETKKLYQQVAHCLAVHGEEKTKYLLDLLGNIDVSKSANCLPSLAELTLIIETLGKTNAPVEYDTIRIISKEGLAPECVINMDKACEVPAESAGNLDMIIAQHITKIMEELTPSKTQVDGALGAGFFDSLATAEGPKKLIEHLHILAKLSDYPYGVVKKSVRDTMRTVYQQAMDEGINHIGVRDTQDNKIKSKITHIIRKEINHRINKENDFASFVEVYAKELDALSDLLGNLKRMNHAWPVEINKIIDAFNCPHLKSYSLPVLAQITTSLVNNFDPSNAFPSELFKQFLAFEATLSIEANIKTILDIISDKEQAFSDEEKHLLCEFALHDPERRTANLPALLESRTKNKELFTTRLKLHLSTNATFDDFNKAFDKISALKPQSIATMTDFFIKNKDKNLNFIDIVNEIETSKASLVLPIVVKASQKNINEATQETITDLIAHLQKCNEATLKQLNSLYSSARYPSLSQLINTMKKEEKESVETVQHLQRQYDCEPLSEDKRNFNTQQLNYYLDESQDLNHGRPLLLTQRQELRKWFLYVNAIGNNRPIDTQTMAEGEKVYKSIKEMTHDEIQILLTHYREQFKLGKSGAISKESLLKARLEVIAILREVMYRTASKIKENGEEEPKFPRPTQILYLLNAMQNGNDFIAQIPTGQGKSMTVALAAAMANIEGEEVDVCTSDLPLAEEGLAENREFFDYVDIPTALISASSKNEEYQQGAIHYSCMESIALYRSKMQLLGKKFPEQCTLIADEVDFSILDDNTRYRYAVTLDPVTDPDKSPYTWIYEALVQFVDEQNTPKTDAEFLEDAKNWLNLVNQSKTKEQRAQFKALEQQAEVYNKRLETWLIAAAETKQLAKYDEKDFRQRISKLEEQPKFRVVQLDHKKGSISKACILSGSRPSIDAEYSDAIQQFLHVRLRQQYNEKIEKGEMADFLVEPEKTYVSTQNARILVNTYTCRLGMTGTAGSKDEIKEQYANYGFRFVGIPSFAPSNRHDEDPILTDAKWVNNLVKEEENHIQLIVKETLRHIQSKKGNAAPILIHCANKEQGEKINKALTAALGNKKVNAEVQSYYSSENPDPKARLTEEKEKIKKAGQKNTVTISTVFSRGTDIKPPKKLGLYTIDTFVNTATEDLERSKVQKLGRSGRAGQIGTTRLIIRQSEFAAICEHNADLKKISNTKEGLDAAIVSLNKHLNIKRVAERGQREFFDDVKDIFSKEFDQYINFINQIKGIPKKEIKANLLAQKNILFDALDSGWDNLSHDFDEEHKLGFIQNACEKWAKIDANLQNNVKAWLKRQQLETNNIPIPQELVAENILKTVTARKPIPEPFYVRSAEHIKLEDTSTIQDEAAVYADFMRTSENKKVNGAKYEAIKQYIEQQSTYLNTLGRKQKVTVDVDEKKDAEKVKEIMQSLLSLRYQAYCSGNVLDNAKLNVRCNAFVKQILWSEQGKLISSLYDAHTEHFKTITSRQGNSLEEQLKSIYLRVLAAQENKLFTPTWGEHKKNNFKSWWTTQKLGLKDQAKEWLLSYRDKWWTRTWVSDSRQDVATKLLTVLVDETKSDKLIAAIATARKTLLTDDNNKPLKNSIEGRLYQYLDQLECKVYAAMAPDEIEKCIDEVFAKNLSVLERAKNSGINHQCLNLIISDLNQKESTTEKKYQALMIFFNNILSTNKPKEVSQENWEVLRSYCQKTKLQLPYHFAQCDESSKLNKQRSVQVY